MKKLILLGLFLLIVLSLSSCLILPDGSILMYDPWDEQLEYYPSHGYVHYEIHSHHSHHHGHGY